MPAVDDCRSEAHARTHLSELARYTYSTSCEFHDAARSRMHAVTIVRCHRGGRYVQMVDFSACQATAGATNVEQSCSRGLPGRYRTGRYYGCYPVISCIHTSTAEVRDRSRGPT